MKTISNHLGSIYNNITVTIYIYPIQHLPFNNTDSKQHKNMIAMYTRGATVTGCAPVVSYCCIGLYLYDKQS